MTRDFYKPLFATITGKGDNRQPKWYLEMCLHLAFLLIHKSEALAESKFKIHPLMNKFRKRYPCPRSLQIPAPRKMGTQSDGTKFFQNATVQKAYLPPKMDEVLPMKGTMLQRKPSPNPTINVQNISFSFRAGIQLTLFFNLPLLTLHTFPRQTKPQRPIPTVLGTSSSSQLLGAQTPPLSRSGKRCKRCKITAHVSSAASWEAPCGL